MMSLTGIRFAGDKEVLQRLANAARGALVVKSLEEALAQGMGHIYTTEAVKGQQTYVELLNEPGLDTFLKQAAAHVSEPVTVENYPGRQPVQTTLKAMFAQPDTLVHLMTPEEGRGALEQFLEFFRGLDLTSPDQRLLRQTIKDPGNLPSPQALDHFEAEVSKP
jgi:hypothetical protein